MPPSAIAVMQGIAFVFLGVLKILSDRWQLHLHAQGRKMHHSFDHIFFRTFVEQFCQMCLLFLNCVINTRQSRISEQDTPPALPTNTSRQAINDDQPDNSAEVPNDAPREDLRRLRRRRSQSPKPASKLIYLMPAVFYLASVLLVFFASRLTYDSSLIMFKGTTPLFGAVLATALLTEHVGAHAWFGLVVSAVGFCVAGLSDYFNPPTVNVYEGYGIASGDLLIVMAQISIASWRVYEERFIRKYDIHPLKFLGGEGVYGVILFGGLLVVSYLVKVSTYYSYAVPGTDRLEDPYDAYLQLKNRHLILVPFVGSVVLHLLWSYLGLVLVRWHGALVRLAVESLVVTFYCGTCLALQWDIPKWDAFNWEIIQLPSLCATVFGLLFFAKIIPFPTLCGPRNTEIRATNSILRRMRDQRGDTQPLVNSLRE